MQKSSKEKVREMEDLSLVKCCFLVLFLVWTTDSQPQPGIIQTSCGRIKGSLLSVSGRGVYQYLGIPYAQPPVGDLRFRKPKPIQPWSQTLIANRMPPACIQYALYNFPWRDIQNNKSEDCLYLNIWVPDIKIKKCNKRKIPVMFWLYGGGFAYGSIRKPVYNGRALAAEGGVIVVTANYRLGAFGFFTTNTDDAPLNVAMYDMLEALQWVNKNIEAFGGDPNQVTIFGESAGSIAAGLFCISPLTKGLFKRVIMESGSPASVMFDVNTTSVAISQKLAEALGCSDPPINILTFPDKVADCMRKKDAWEIAKTLNSFDPNTGFVYLPVYGDDFLPDSPRVALNTGKMHNVSVLIGNNKDEGSVLITSASPQLFGFLGKKFPKLNASTAENLYKSVLKKNLKDIPGTDLLIQTILGTLSKDDYKKNLKIIYDFLGDFTLVCPDVYFAEIFSRFGKDTYFYFFTQRPSSTPWAKWMGVAHYAEVPFVFGIPVMNKNQSRKVDVNLSKYMMGMWSNFAKTGYPLPDKSKGSNPSSGSLVPSDLKLKKWPKYSYEKPLYLKLDKNTMKAKQFDLGPHKVNCDLFRPIHGYPHKMIDGNVLGIP